MMCCGCWCLRRQTSVRRRMQAATRGYDIGYHALFICWLVPLFLEDFCAFLFDNPSHFYGWNAVITFMSRFISADKYHHAHCVSFVRLFKRITLVTVTPTVLAADAIDASILRFQEAAREELRLFADFLLVREHSHLTWAAYLQPFPGMPVITLSSLYISVFAVLCFFCCVLRFFLCRTKLVPCCSRVVIYI